MWEKKICLVVHATSIVIKIIEENLIILINRYLWHKLTFYSINSLSLELSLLVDYLHLLSPFLSEIGVHQLLNFQNRMVSLHGLILKDALELAIQSFNECINHIRLTQERTLKTSNWERGHHIIFADCESHRCIQSNSHYRHMTRKCCNSQFWDLKIALEFIWV